MSERTYLREGMNEMNVMRKKEYPHLLDNLLTSMGN